MAVEGGIAELNGWAFFDGCAAMNIGDASTGRAANGATESNVRDSSNSQAKPARGDEYRASLVVPRCQRLAVMRFTNGPLGAAVYARAGPILLKNYLMWNNWLTDKQLPTSPASLDTHCRVVEIRSPKSPTIWYFLSQGVYMKPRTFF